MANTTFTDLLGSLMGAGMSPTTTDRLKEGLGAGGPATGTDVGNLLNSLGLDTSKIGDILGGSGKIGDILSGKGNLGDLLGGPARLAISWVVCSAVAVKGLAGVSAKPCPAPWKKLKRPSAATRIWPWRPWGLWPGPSWAGARNP